MHLFVFVHEYRCFKKLKLIKFFQQQNMIKAMNHAFLLRKHLLGSLGPGVVKTLTFHAQISGPLFGPNRC